MSISTEFDHLLIVVKNLKESIEFYKLLGFEYIETLQRPDDSVSRLQLGDFKIELMFLRNNKGTEGQIRKLSDSGFRHIGFRVKDVNEIYEKYKDLIKFDSKPTLVQNRPGRLTVFFKDPNGIEMHFVQE